MLRLLQKHGSIRPGQMKELAARLEGDSGGGNGFGGGSNRVSSPVLGASRGAQALAAARRPSTSTLSGGREPNGTTRRTSSTSSSDGGQASLLNRTGSGLGGSAKAATSGAARAHAQNASLLSRPATVSGGEQRPAGRTLSGGTQGTFALADPNDLPPYGRATGVVSRIAEGAPPRPAHVDSDRELSSEIDKVVTQLDPSIEWLDRLKAMVRIEALLLGGAAEWDSFPNQLVKLRKPLTTQVADRRSAIVRQAAHLLVILAAELGGEFEKDATHFVPELFKCSVITVQIIAESGDYGVRGILHNCQARHLVPKLCETASKDRSVKLRALAAGWLRVVVHTWDGLGGQRNHELLEQAVGEMVSDGAPDVRAGARRLFSAYQDKYPEWADRLRDRFDGNTKRLIQQEAATGAHDETEIDVSALLQRPHTAALKTRDRSNAQRPNTVSASAGRTRGVLNSDKEMERRPSTLRRAEGGSLGGSLGTNPGGAFDHEQPTQRPATTSLTERGNRVGAVGGMATTAARAAAAAARRSSGIGVVAGVSGRGGGVELARKERTAAAARKVDDDSVRRVSSRERPQSREAPTREHARPVSRETSHAKARSPSPPAPPQRPITVSAALDCVFGLGARGSPLSSSGRRTPSATWEAKTAAFDNLASALRAGGSRCVSDASSRARDLADVFVQHVGDPHHRVAHAVLEAIVEAIPVCGASLEPELEKLCPPLFPRLVDAKENVRGLASAALAAVGDQHPADAILPALLASLDASKAPRAKTGVLEFALYVLSGQGGGTDPDNASRALQPASAGSASLRRWVARVAPLVSDRHAPLRAAAAAGLAAVHVRADPVAVLRHLVSMSVSDAAMTCRAVGQHAPQIENEFHAYAAAERRAAERVSADAGRAAETYDARSYDDDNAFGDESESEEVQAVEAAASPSESSVDEDEINAAAEQEELRALQETRRAARETELVEKARAVREEQRREETRSALRSAELAEETQRARLVEHALREEERARVEEERAVEADDGFASTSDATSSATDDELEIENEGTFERARRDEREEAAVEQEQTQEHVVAKQETASVKLASSESAAIRAYRESRLAADASVERLAAARATLAMASEPKPTAMDRTTYTSAPQKEGTAVTASPALAEALQALAVADAASPTATGRALASVRRVLRGSGVSVTSQDARVIVLAASTALRSTPRGAGGTETSAETKTHALFTLRDLARSSPTQFAPFAQIALPVILDALDDSEGTGPTDPEVALGAGDALDGVVDALAPEVALAALAPRLTNARGVVTSAAPVRCVGGIIARMTPEALERACSTILPSLTEAFSSTSADVRKAVVDALVAMYDSLGDWLLPKLTSLTAAQQKLLTIYINRAAERREKGGLGKVGGVLMPGRVPLAPRPPQ